MSNPDGRSSILHRLGFASYAKYLKSGLWLNIKMRVYDHKGCYCEICHAPPHTVHHALYSEANLSGKSIRGLHPICNRCHESIHIDPVTRRKVSLARVARRFAYLRPKSKRLHF